MKNLLSLEAKLHFWGLGFARGFAGIMRESSDKSGVKSGDSELPLLGHQALDSIHREFKFGRLR